jgi:putative PIN family toxin of toxin-antitoxin system
VVLDTNVLLSACLKPNGLEAQVVHWAIEQKLIACVTPEVWLEYEDVLFRAKFESVRSRAEGVLESLRAKSLCVSGGEPLSIASDEDDNRFIECAVSAKAVFLITGNGRHYPAEHDGTKIVNARNFFTLYSVAAVRAALK